MAQLQQNAVHNHTAAMLEMGTNLLSQTAEQTRKLTDVETQVTPHETHQMQMLSNALVAINQSRCVPHYCPFIISLSSAHTVTLRIPRMLH